MYPFISNFYLQLWRQGWMTSSLSDHPQILTQSCSSSKESPMQSAIKGAVGPWQPFCNVSCGALGWPHFSGLLGLVGRWIISLRRSSQPFPTPLTPLWHVLVMNLPAFEECNPAASIIRPSSLLRAARTVWFAIVMGCQLGRTAACLHTGTVASTSVIWYLFPSSFLETYMSVKLFCFQELFPPGIFSCRFSTHFLRSGKSIFHVGLSLVFTTWDTFPSTRSQDLTKAPRLKVPIWEQTPHMPEKAKLTVKLRDYLLGVCGSTFPS